MANGEWRMADGGWRMDPSLPQRGIGKALPRRNRKWNQKPDQTAKERAKSGIQDRSRISCFRWVCNYHTLRRPLRARPGFCFYYPFICGEAFGLAPYLGRSIWDAASGTLFQHLGSLPQHPASEIVKRRANSLGLEPVVVSLFGRLRLESLDRPDRAREQLHARGSLDEY
jgi:hypothetical protein